jgi:beta-N-acetylglucosaminidase
MEIVNVGLLILMVLALNYCAYNIGLKNGQSEKYKYALEEIKKYKEWSSTRIADLLNEITSEYKDVILGRTKISEKALKDMELADLYRMEHGLMTTEDIESNIKYQ